MNQSIMENEKILAVVAEYYEVKVEEIIGNAKGQKISLAQEIVMYLGKEINNAPLEVICKLADGCDRSTVIRRICDIEKRIATEDELKRQISEIKDTLNSETSNEVRIKISKDNKDLYNRFYRMLPQMAKSLRLSDDIRLQCERITAWNKKYEKNMEKDEKDDLKSADYKLKSAFVRIRSIFENKDEVVSDLFSEIFANENIGKEIFGSYRNLFHAKALWEAEELMEDLYEIMITSEYEDLDDVEGILQKLLGYESLQNPRNSL